MRQRSVHALLRRLTVPESVIYHDSTGWLAVRHLSEPFQFPDTLMPDSSSLHDEFELTQLCDRAAETVLREQLCHGRFGHCLPKLVELAPLDQ